VTFSFDPQAGLIVIPTRLSGPNKDTVARLALDTGATVSMVRADILDYLEYAPASAKDRVSVTTASGVEYAPVLSMERIEALDQVRTDFPILSHTLPPTATIDGLLGLDFFRGRRLILDFREGTIELD